MFSPIVELPESLINASARFLAIETCCVRDTDIARKRWVAFVSLLEQWIFLSLSRPTLQSRTLRYAYLRITLRVNLRALNKLRAYIGSVLGDRCRIVSHASITDGICENRG